MHRNTGCHGDRRRPQGNRADGNDRDDQERLDTIGVESTEESRRFYRKLLFTAPGLEDDRLCRPLRRDDPSEGSDDGTPFTECSRARARSRASSRHGRPRPRRLPRREGDRGLDGLGRGSRSTRASARASQVACGDHDRGRASRPTASAGTRHALARYAALCQEPGIVPIVEPEVIDGRHDRGAGRSRRGRCKRRFASSTASASTSRARCSSRTWSSRARAARSRPARDDREGDRRLQSSMFRPRSPASSSSPAASRRSRRPRT